MEHNSKLTSRAQYLRKNMTKEERRLWYEYLHSYPLRFRRQVTFGNYILDFYCAAAKLAVELDGSQHYDPDEQRYDQKRTAYLYSIGIEVLRFSNLDVLQNLRGVCQEIDLTIARRGGLKHLPSLSRRSPMNNIKRLIPILLFVFFTFGCQRSRPTTGNTVPVTETVLQEETVSTEVPSTAEATEPGVDQYQAFQWMVNLKAEDVAYVEFINLNDSALPYRRYEGAEIQEVIDLFQAKQCLEDMPPHPAREYAPIVQWPGYYSKEFHVVMKDGTAHTICSVYSVATVIDGTGFHTISAWLNHYWPKSGNAPLPEDWVQEVAARNYHTADCVSTLSTAAHDAQRENLNYSYDTEVTFGSLSRHYPIGRGGIELSASGASTTGVSLSAYWTGTAGLTQLHVQPQYWLEKWQEDIECYISFDDGQFLSEPQELLSDNTRYWYLSWKDACGSLEPGHYRVGMTFYEEYNGSIQNETTCYAKFTISESN